MKKKSLLICIIAILSCLFLCSCQELLNEIEKAVDTQNNQSTQTSTTTNTTKSMATNTSADKGDITTVSSEFGDLRFNTPSSWELFDEDEETRIYQISNDQFACLWKKPTGNIFVTKQKLLDAIDGNLKEENLVREFTLSVGNLSCYEISTTMNSNGSKLAFDGYGFKYSNNVYTIGVINKQWQGSRDISCLDPLISSLSLVEESGSKKTVTFNNIQYNIDSSWRDNSNKNGIKSYYLKESFIAIAYEADSYDLTSYSAEQIAKELCEDILKSSVGGNPKAKTSNTKTTLIDDDILAYEIQVSSASVPEYCFTFCIFSDSKGLYAVVFLETDVNKGLDVDSYKELIDSITIINKTTPTPLPTATPKPTVTPKPTATPKPTLTPAPTLKPTSTPKPTAKPKPTATPKPKNNGGGSYTVYVSRNNVMHLKSNCSGMKYYETMSYSSAVARGASRCSKCFK